MGDETIVAESCFGGPAIPEKRALGSLAGVRSLVIV
jgi:hypothetical protein